MTKFLIIMSGAGGELDRAEAVNLARAKAKLLAMIEAVELRDGDTFTVTRMKKEDE
jgi:hypothetical protein